MACKEYRLKKPIQWDDETIDVLQFEEPDARKLIDAEVDLSEEALKKVKGMMGLIEACCTNANGSQLARMKFSDLGGAVEVCAGFFS